MNNNNFRIESILLSSFVAGRGISYAITVPTRQDTPITQAGCPGPGKTFTLDDNMSATCAGGGTVGAGTKPNPNPGTGPIPDHTVTVISIIGVLATELTGFGVTGVAAGVICYTLDDDGGTGTGTGPIGSTRMVCANSLQACPTKDPLDGRCGSWEFAGASPCSRTCYGDPGTGGILTNPVI